MKNLKSCPHCGSTNVEEFLAGFFKANEPSLDKATDGDVSLAELYSDLYYCPNCETHPSHLVEGPVETVKFSTPIWFEPPVKGAKVVWLYRDGGYVRSGWLMPELSEWDPRRRAYQLKQEALKR